MGGDRISLDPRQSHQDPCGQDSSKSSSTAERTCLAVVRPDREDVDVPLDIRRLVDLYLDSVYRFAFRLSGSAADADDLVQETFLIAQQNLHQLREPRAALPWLFRILRSCRARNGRRALPSLTVPVEEIVDASDSGEEIDELDSERLVTVLGSMPDEYREPLLLFYFEELSYREIAQALECPMGTVMSRISRGKAYLRSRLVPTACAKE